MGINIRYFFSRSFSCIFKLSSIFFFNNNLKNKKFLFFFKFETAFRMSFYGDVQAKRDTAKMQLVRGKKTNNKIYFYYFFFD